MPFLNHFKNLNQTLIKAVREIYQYSVQTDRQESIGLQFLNLSDDAMSAAQVSYGIQWRRKPMVPKIKFVWQAYHMHFYENGSETTAQKCIST